MDAVNYQWYYDRMSPPMVAVFKKAQEQLATLERKVEAIVIERQSIQNSYHQPQNNYTPSSYHPGWQDHSSYSWNNNQDQYFAPSYYQQDFQYPLPQPQEQKSDLEEILERFLEPTEMRMNNQEFFAPEQSYPPEYSYQPQPYEISYQQPPPQQEKKSNLEEIFAEIQESTERSLKSSQELGIQIDKLASVVTSCLHKILSSNTEIDHEEEGKELCEANTLESGKELQEAVRKNLKRTYSDGEEDCGVVTKRSKIEIDEEEDGDDQALNLNGIEKNPMVSYVQQSQNCEEYYRIDFVQENNSDEFKFGGGLQVFMHAMTIKEKTTRRHAKIIFAIEPD